MPENYIPNIRIEDFNYNLPDEVIAYYPMANRQESKLLVYDSGTDSISHHGFSDIKHLIPAGSLIILNETKVISARIQACKPTGGKAEILCVEPITPGPDPQVAMIAKPPVKWKCIIGGRKIEAGIVLSSGDNCKARILEKQGSEAIVEFSWQDQGLSFAELLHQIGKTPLPPYIKREPESSDENRYQTIYAKNDGSVAAPTAGLHFNNEIINSMKKSGIDFANLTLHVGPGTFKPVDAEDISGHEMHEEQIHINIQTIAKIHRFLKNRLPEAKLVSTGTTSLRSLESIYWLGVMIIKGEIKNTDLFEIGQWYPYRFGNDEELPDAAEAFGAVLKNMEDNGSTELFGKTKVIIVPNYRIRTAEALITNFHLPKSTLILLVAAFSGGDNWRRIYQEALSMNYRFLSYGDSSLIIRERPVKKGI